MTFWFDEKEDEHAYNEEEEKEEDFAFCGALLVARCLWKGELMGHLSCTFGLFACELRTYHGEFPISGLDVHRHALYVIVYAIQHGALIDDHSLELAEYIR